MRTLDELLKGGLILRPYRGHWELADKTVAIQADPRGLVGIHDLLLVGQFWPTKGHPAWHKTPTTGSDGTSAPVAPVGPDPEPVGTWDWSKATYEPDGRYWELRLAWRDRWMRVRWHPGPAGEPGTLTVGIPAERSPIEFEEMGNLEGWLTAHTDPLDAGRKFEMRKVGINRDMWLWELDGLRSIRLRAWTNGFRQIYQKYRLMVRDEAHLTLREMSLRDGVEAIMGLSPTALLAKAVAGEAQKAQDEPERPAPPRPPPTDIYG